VAASPCRSGTSPDFPLVREPVVQGTVSQRCPQLRPLCARGTRPVTPGCGLSSAVARVVWPFAVIGAGVPATGLACRRNVPGTLLAVWRLTRERGAPYVGLPSTALAPGPLRWVLPRAFWLARTLPVARPLYVPLTKGEPPPWMRRFSQRTSPVSPGWHGLAHSPLPLGRSRRALTLAGSGFPASRTSIAGRPAVPWF
jgi:hypothetical protein